MDDFAYQWHITDRCDQRCRHCYIFSEGHHTHNKEVSLQQAAAVVQNSLDMCSRINRRPYFYLTGGDPLLHPGFWQIVAMLREHNIPYSILGNPFHLTDEVCYRLKGSGCDKYQLSIDGMRTTHDTIRKPGSFDDTIRKIELIRHAGLRCAVMTTVSGTNIKEIPDVIDLVVEKQVDLFAFARYCPTSPEKSTHIEPLEYRAFLETAWEKFGHYKESPTIFNLKDHLWTLFLYEKGLFRIPYYLHDDQIYDGCNCANCHLTILPDGIVMACRRFDNSVGNAYEENLYDIFNGEKIEAYRHYETFEKCSRCELLRFCRGCPAVAYGYTRRFYAPDPQCWKNI